MKRNRRCTLVLLCTLVALTVFKTTNAQQDEDIPGEGGDAPAAVFVLPQQPPYELPNQMTTHIKSCMTKDILPHYETCCPHITPVLESLIADQPMPLKVRLTPLTCNILCVHGVSTHYCSRDVTETFMKITYAAILSYIKPDVREYFLIPPQPPYNVPDLLTNVVNECTSKVQEQFEKCCSGISHVIQCIIDSKPLPPHFLSFKTCNTICMSMTVKTKCKEEDMSPFFELIYSILFHYHQNNRYEDSLFVLPRKPPYQLSEDMNIHIRTCMKRTIVPHFEKCCPHITPVYECILTNQPIPTQYKITPFTCNILCVHGVSIIYCSPEASGTILKITFGAILFYTRPATKQYYVIPPHPPYHIPSKMLTVLQDCTIRIHDKFEKCCRGISQVIQFLVDEKPLPPHVISFKDCNTVCLSETVQQLCKEEDVNPIFEFIYSIILHYFDNVKHDFTKAGLTSSGSDVQHSPDHMPGPVQPGDADEDPCCPYVKSLPPHPPYGFDETVIEKIKSCMTQEIKPHFDECCPNYSEVVQCIIDNQPLPNHDISPIICNYLCIYQVTTTHCNHPGTPAAFFQITYSIMMHYLQPELERLFVLFAHPPWKVENGIKSANKACLAEVRQKFDDCCSGMTQSIQNIIADKPLPLNLISFQHCNPICVYETVQKLCENGAIVPLFQLTYAIMYYYFSVTNKKQGANAEAEAEAEAIIPHVPTEPPEAEPREEFIDNKLPDEDAGAPCCEVFVFPSKPPFQLSEDMVKSIRQCLQRKIVPHYEKCCPHITPVYECLLTNKPMPPMQITALTCNFLCVLGVASTYCPEESHAVMFQVTYVTILRYMQPGMQQAFVLPKLPPWNLPETMINHLKKCTSTLKPKLEQCCKGITQVYQSIIDGQPLQSHIISFKQCNSVCICSLVEKQCSKDAVLTFFQVTYAACYYYFTQMSRSRIPVPSNFQETGEPSPTTDIIAGFILPSSPPYELPSQMLQNLKSCINSDTTPHLEICCPSITQVYKSLMDNEPFPLDSPLDVFNCNFLCVHGVIQGQCPQTETQMMFMKTTYAAILIYMQPGVKEYLVLPPAPPWNIPDNFMEFIKKCSTTLSTRFEQCCSGISVCIQAIMSEKPLPPNVISFRSCNLICVYQVVEQQCNPEAVLPFFHVTYAIIYHFLSMTISDPGGGGAPQIANTMTRPDTLPETQAAGEGDDPANQQAPDCCVTFPNKPPYNLGKPIMTNLKMCAKQELFSHYEKCCPDITPIFESLLEDKPLPQKEITILNCNMLCVHGAALTYCSPLATPHFLKLVYSAIMHYAKPGFTDHYMLPSEPPYKLPNNIKDSLTGCFNKVKSKFPPCCEGIVGCFEAVMNEAPLPKKGITVQHCNTLCVFKEIEDKCGDEAIFPFFQLTYSILYSYIKGKSLNQIPELPSVYQELPQPRQTQAKAEPEPRQIQAKAEPEPRLIQAKAVPEPRRLQVKDVQLKLPDHPPYNINADMLVHMKSCLKRSIKPHYDRCCPNMYDVIEAICTDKPFPEERIELHECNFLCVHGVVCTYCQSEVQPTFLKVIHSILAHYEEMKTTVRQTYYELPESPPYNVPEKIMIYMKRCYIPSQRPKFDKCCDGITQCFDSILQNKKLPMNIISFKQCNTICIYHILREKCDKAAVFSFFQIIYAIIYNYFMLLNNNLLTKIMRVEENPEEHFFTVLIPSKPPYNLPEDLSTKLKLCLKRSMVPHYEKCCPHISTIYDCIVTNKPLPKVPLDELSCNILCIHGVAVNYCSNDVIPAFIKVTYAIVLLYAKTGLHEYYILPPAPPYKCPELIKKHVKECMTQVQGRIEKCCVGLTMCMDRVLRDLSLPRNVISFRSCDTICIMKMVQKSCREESALPFYEMIYAIIIHFVSITKVTKDVKGPDGQPMPPVITEEPNMKPGELTLKPKVKEHETNPLQPPPRPIPAPRPNPPPRPIPQHGPKHPPHPMSPEEPRANRPGPKPAPEPIPGPEPQKPVPSEPEPPPGSVPPHGPISSAGLNDCCFTIPPTPPYNLPTELVSNIKLCFKRQTAPHYQQCCPNIVPVFIAVLTNRPFPQNELSMYSCNLLCLHAVVISYCGDSIQTQINVIKLAYSVMTRYMKPSPKVQYAIPMQHPPYNCPETILGPVKKIFSNVKDSMDKCCNGMSKCIEIIINGKEIMPPVGIDFENCDTLCMFRLIKRSSSEEASVPLFQITYAVLLYYIVHPQPHMHGKLPAASEHITEMHHILPVTPAHEIVPVHQPEEAPTVPVIPGMIIIPQQPPYKLSADIVAHMKECMRMDLQPRYERCCRNIFEVFQCIIDNKPFPEGVSTINELNCNILCVHATAERYCSNKIKGAIMQLTYAVVLHFVSPKLAKYYMLPPKPPFNVPESMQTLIKNCFTTNTEIASQLDQCCSGIAVCFQAVLSNRKLPNVGISLTNCNMPCICRTSAKTCKTRGLGVLAFYQMTFAILFHYSQAGTPFKPAPAAAPPGPRPAIPHQYAPQEQPQVEKPFSVVDGTQLVQTRTQEQAERGQAYMIDQGPPPYKILPEIAHMDIEMCLKQENLEKYDHCCPTISTCFRAIADLKPLPRTNKISALTCDIACVARIAEKSCNKEVAASYAKMTYAIVLDQLKTPIYKYLLMQPQPPYGVLDHIKKSLKECPAQKMQSHLQQCCPRITECYFAAITDKPMPTIKIFLNNCNTLCVAQHVGEQCGAEHVMPYYELTFAIILHYVRATIPEKSTQIKPIPPLISKKIGGESVKQTEREKTVQQTGHEGAVQKPEHGGAVQQTEHEGAVQKPAHGGVVQQAGHGGVVQQTGGGGVVQQTGSEGGVQQTGGGAVVQQTEGGGVVQQTGGGGVVQQTGSGGVVQQTGSGGVVQQTEHKVVLQQTGSGGGAQQTEAGGGIKKIGVGENLQEKATGGAAQQTVNKDSVQQTGPEGAVQQTEDDGAVQGTGGGGAAQQTGNKESIQQTGPEGAVQQTGDDGTVQGTGGGGAAQQTGNKESIQQTGPEGAVQQTGKDGDDQQTGKDGVVQGLPSNVLEDSESSKKTVKRGVPHYGKDVTQHLTICMKKSIQQYFEKCCPNIIPVFQSILKQKELPSAKISSNKCSVLCVSEVADRYCMPEARQSFLQLTYAILRHYEQPDESTHLPDRLGSGTDMFGGVTFEGFYRDSRSLYNDRRRRNTFEYKSFPRKGYSHPEVSLNQSTSFGNIEGNTTVFGNFVLDENHLFLVPDNLLWYSDYFGGFIPNMSIENTSFEFTTNPQFNNEHVENSIYILRAHNDKPHMTTFHSFNSLHLYEDNDIHSNEIPDIPYSRYTISNDTKHSLNNTGLVVSSRKRRIRDTFDPHPSSAAQSPYFSVDYPPPSHGQWPSQGYAMYPPAPKPPYPLPQAGLHERDSSVLTPLQNVPVHHLPPHHLPPHHLPPQKYEDHPYLPPITYGYQAYPPPVTHNAQNNSQSGTSVNMAYQEPGMPGNHPFQQSAIAPQPAVVSQINIRGDNTFPQPSSNQPLRPVLEKDVRDHPQPPKEVYKNISISSHRKGKTLADLKNLLSMPHLGKTGSILHMLPLGLNNMGKSNPVLPFGLSHMLKKNPSKHLNVSKFSYHEPMHNNTEYQFGQIHGSQGEAQDPLWSSVDIASEAELETGEDGGFHLSGDTSQNVQISNHHDDDLKDNADHVHAPKLDGHKMAFGWKAGEPEMTESEEQSLHRGIPSAASIIQENSFRDYDNQWDSGREQQDERDDDLTGSEDLDGQKLTYGWKAGEPELTESEDQSLHRGIPSAESRRNYENSVEDSDDQWDSSLERYGEKDGDLTGNEDYVHVPKLDGHKLAFGLKAGEPELTESEEHSLHILIPSAESRRNHENSVEDYDDQWDSSLERYGEKDDDLTGNEDYVQVPKLDGHKLAFGLKAGEPELTESEEHSLHIGIPSAESRNYENSVGDYDDQWDSSLERYGEKDDDLTGNEDYVHVPKLDGHKLAFGLKAFQPELTESEEQWFHRGIPSAESRNYENSVGDYDEQWDSSLEQYGEKFISGQDNEYKDSSDYDEPLGDYDDRLSDVDNRFDDYMPSLFKRNPELKTQIDVDVKYDFVGDNQDDR